MHKTRALAASSSPVAASVSVSLAFINKGEGKGEEGVRRGVFRTDAPILCMNWCIFLSEPHLRGCENATQLIQILRNFL